jgi:hypothetical protein
VGRASEGQKRVTHTHLRFVWVRAVRSGGSRAASPVLAIGRVGAAIGDPYEKLTLLRTTPLLCTIRYGTVPKR